MGDVTELSTQLDKAEAEIDELKDRIIVAIIGIVRRLSVS